MEPGSPQERPNDGTSGGLESEHESRVSDLKNPTFWKCAAIILVLNLSFYSMAAPGVRIIELAVCREYYIGRDPTVITHDGLIPERLCKVNEIQGKVAWLLMGNQLLGFLGGALPYKHGVE